MALYSELQVFKTSYDLLILVFRATPNVKREYRYCLLENIKKDTIKLCTQIYRTNSSKEKELPLTQALETVMELRLQCRVLRDLDQISVKLFIQIFETLDSISKQLTLWRKYHVQTKTNPTKTGVPNHHAQPNTNNTTTIPNPQPYKNTEQQYNTTPPEPQTRGNCETPNRESIL